MSLCLQKCLLIQNVGIFSYTSKERERERQMIKCNSFCTKSSGDTFKVLVDDERVLVQNEVTKPIEIIFHQW
jgi:hypothetical protein